MFQREVPIKNNMLFIREAKTTDAEEMIRYVNTIAGESNNITFGPGEFNVSIKQQTEVIQQYLSAENKIFLLGFVDDTLVSMLNFASGSRVRTRHTGELGMSVLKKYWRNGIGRQMMSALIDWAKNTGFIRKLNLRVVTTNIAAISLYKSMGFVTGGTITRDMYINGEFISTYHMGLLID